VPTFENGCFVPDAIPVGSRVRVVSGKHKGREGVVLEAERIGPLFTPEFAPPHGAGPSTYQSLESASYSWKYKVKLDGGSTVECDGNTLQRIE